MDMVPNEGTLHMSTPERLRRLARRYVSKQPRFDCQFHSEPGPLGRFQAVIKIDIGDIFGDTNS